MSYVPASDSNTIELHAVRRSYGSTPVLGDAEQGGLELGIGPGVTGLLGPNGAGKTTLLRILATVLAPDTGQVTLLGHDTARADERVEVRRRVGYVPQELGLHADFTPFDFVDYVAILKEHTDRRARHDEVRRVLELLGLGDVRQKRISKLSGGMRRRVTIAQAFLGHPDLLVLDEPTVGLDPEQRLRFRESLSSVRPGTTVVLSTHQTGDIAALCQRVVVLHRGAIRFDGTPADLTASADGHVWLDDVRHPSASVAWTTAEGRVRNVGEAPAGAELAAPTMEDAYLLLAGAEATDSTGYSTGSSTESAA
jgi:ABC-2 type transport system ATP-binding protein